MEENHFLDLRALKMRAVLLPLRDEK